jgi:hypothetical protein
VRGPAIADDQINDERREQEPNEPAQVNDDPVDPDDDPEDPDDDPEDTDDDPEDSDSGSEDRQVMAAVPQFFRNPGEYVAAGTPFVDWSSDRELKNWKAATKGLDNKFDLKHENLMVFLNRVHERARAFSWMTIIDVPHTAAGAAAAEPTNIIENYGLITMEECRAHATTYLAARQRLSQLSAMLYEFLRNSMTADANKILDLTPSSYTIDGLTDGLCLLKQVISKSFVDTMSSVSMIRRTINRLEEKIREFKYDIRTFNQFVETQVAALAAHGIGCDDLEENLYSAYLSVKDDEFMQLVRISYFKHEQSNEPGNPMKLMKVMENHHHRRLTEGTWNPTIGKTDREKIIALESTIAQMKADKSKPTENKEHYNNKRQREPDGEGKWAWKKSAPKQGKPSTMQRGKKTYHWCHKHHMWTIHTPEECTLKEPLKDAVANETTTNNATKEDTKEDKKEGEDKVQMDQAYQSIIGSGGRIFA